MRFEYLPLLAALVQILTAQDDASSEIAAATSAFNAAEAALTSQIGDPLTGVAPSATAAIASYEDAIKTVLATLQSEGAAATGAAKSELLGAAASASSGINQISSIFDAELAYATIAAELSTATGAAQTSLSSELDAAASSLGNLIGLSAVGSGTSTITVTSSKETNSKSSSTGSSSLSKKTTVTGASAGSTTSPSSTSTSHSGAKKTDGPVLGALLVGAALYMI